MGTEVSQNVQRVYIIPYRMNHNLEIQALIMDRSQGNSRGLSGSCQQLGYLLRVHLTKSMNNNFCPGINPLRFQISRMPFH